ncbi:MAG: acyl-CoA dehydrogenase family protein [Halioglobus sp.]|nr:acyl-CoA dehydrogenase family protein [Halioglobus sp.]
MDIKLSEEQVQLQDMARKFMDKHCTFDVVRGIELESDLGFSREMWQQFAEMGWLGMIVPEDHQGMGMGVLDLVVLIRELGRHVCPSPFLYTAVLAADLITQAGSDEQKAQILPRIVAGESIHTFAYQEFSRFFHPRHISLAATSSGDGYSLSGSKLFVEFADGADTLIVAARTSQPGADSGLTLFLVDRDSEGIVTTHMPTMARDRHYQVDFDNVQVPASAVIGEPDRGWEALEPSLHKAIIAFCAYTNGAGFEMHDHATQYAKERVQFGRPIGQMQTIQGYLAQLIMELYGADMLTMFTAFQMDRERHTRGYVAKTKAFSAETVGRVMDVGSQIFGGMGYMEEQDTTLFLRRGKQYQLALGGTEYWEDVIAEEIIDREPVVLT